MKKNLKLLTSITGKLLLHIPQCIECIIPAACAPHFSIESEDIKPFDIILMTGITNSNESEDREQ